MFGKCVWYQIADTHKANILVKSFCEKFNFSFYLAHMTADYDIKTEFDKTKYEIDQGDYFIRYGKPHKTEQNGFYAIEQDYSLRSQPDKLYHVSLAYKNGIPFSNKEFEFIENADIPEIIEKKDIDIRLWNCNSRDPKHWKLFE